MAGEKDLGLLLRSLDVSTASDEFVFVTLQGKTFQDVLEMSPLGAFQEKEGMTLIIKKQDADSQALEYATTFACLTLEVHSSLEAVGLTAAISTKLADHGISANVVAAYYHDHVFVPWSDRRKAETLLKEIAKTAPS